MMLRLWLEKMWPVSERDQPHSSPANTPCERSVCAPAMAFLFYADQKGDGIPHEAFIVVWFLQTHGIRKASRRGAEDEGSTFLSPAVGGVGNARTSHNHDRL